MHDKRSNDKMVERDEFECILPEGQSRDDNNGVIDDDWEPNTSFEIHDGAIISATIPTGIKPHTPNISIHNTKLPLATNAPFDAILQTLSSIGEVPVDSDTSVGSCSHEHSVGNGTSTIPKIQSATTSVSLDPKLWEWKETEDNAAVKEDLDTFVVTDRKQYEKAAAWSKGDYRSTSVEKHSADEERDCQATGDSAPKPHCSTDTAFLSISLSSSTRQCNFPDTSSVLGANTEKDRDTSSTHQLSESEALHMLLNCESFD